MTNKLGLHANVWVAGWSRDEAARAIAKTAESGFDLIEIPALSPDRLDPQNTSRLLAEAGVGATLSLGLDAATDISSGDPGRVAAGEAKLLDAISVGRDLGVSHICGILYSAFQKYDEPPTADGLKTSVATMAKVADKAAASGITLGMEVVNRYETNLINTAAQAVEYCRLVDAPNVGVHLDVYHMHIEEVDLVAAIEETGDHLVYFHTGDSHRGYMGTGSVDLKGAFRALARIGYQGPITYESFSSRVVGQPLTGILGIWRETWESGDDIVAHAMTFTRAQMKAAAESRRRSRLVGDVG
ncbi:sugar phosphate isomerase/epimerase family protein [Rubellimicrobium arenae]|uniref:sugar phosphate isomerase/epimerase family protein n=1 Tax=Rubellimicrobium arenae TaxID=2817372 RepID=UPI001B3095EC|nr:sugar phosphate isomerase/epimerase [Rubellimicrobium arenae]